MMITTGFLGPPEVLRLTIPAESNQQDLFCLRQFAQTPRNFIAIHARQSNIEKNDLWFKYLRHLNSGKPVHCGLNCMSLQFQQHPGGHGCVSVIFYDKDALCEGCLLGCDRLCHRQGNLHFGNNRQTDNELATLIQPLTFRLDIPAL